MSDIGKKLQLLRATHGQLFDLISAALFRADPIGIAFAENTDEYDIETASIIVELEKCECRDDVLKVVHGVFVQYFGAKKAGAVDKYFEAAGLIWDAWRSKTTNI